MPIRPNFIAPARFTDPAAALAQVMRIYDSSIAHLREAMARFAAGDDLGGCTPTRCRSMQIPNWRG
jgi:AMP nucleosidase